MRTSTSTSSPTAGTRTPFGTWIRETCMCGGSKNQRWDPSMMNGESERPTDSSTPLPSATARWRMLLRADGALRATPCDVPPPITRTAPSLGARRCRYCRRGAGSPARRAAALEGGVGINVKEIDIDIKAGIGEINNINNKANGEMRFNNNTTNIKDIEDFENKLNNRQSFYYKKYKSQYRFT